MTKDPNYSKEWIEEWTPLWGKHTEGILKKRHRNQEIIDGLMNAYQEVKEKDD